MHLSGYLHVDDSFDYSSDEEMEEEEEDVPTLVPAGKGKSSPLDRILAAQKKKGDKSEITPQNDKEVKKEIEKALNMRKKLAEDAKKKGAVVEVSDEDEDDEDDEDFEDMDDEEEGDEEEDEDDDDDDEEDDEDEDDDEEESEEEVSPKKNGKIQMNGTAPKPKEKGKENQTPKKNEPAKAKNEPKTPKTPNSAAQAAKTPKTPNASDNATAAKTPKTPKRTLKGGIVVEDLKVGSGPEAARGKMCGKLKKPLRSRVRRFSLTQITFIGFYYEGRLKDNNKKFDSCKNGDPFKFRLGTGEVIKGWDVGLEGMKVGGKRRLIVPAKMAYGDKGSPPSIPSNATLVFEFECKSVK